MAAITLIVMFIFAPDLTALVLVVFLECEFNQEERQMLDFDAPELFSRLLDSLKEYEKNIWLISHVRLAPLECAFGHRARDSFGDGVIVLEQVRLDAEQLGL